MECLLKAPSEEYLCDSSGLPRCSDPQQCLGSLTSFDCDLFWALPPISPASSSPSSTATPSVLHHQHPERIRLSVIYCHEKGQAFGKHAKYAASELAFGKEVTVQTLGHDKYKRTIGDAILPDGTNVNHLLVKDSWCWWYPKYAPRNRELERLEKNAREAKKALWAVLQPVPPWEWRKLGRARR